MRIELGKWNLIYIGLAFSSFTEMKRRYQYGCTEFHHEMQGLIDEWCAIITLVVKQVADCDYESKCVAHASDDFIKYDRKWSQAW